MANKLSGEASEQELEELEQLLREHPELSYQYESISDFWNSKTVMNEEADTKVFQKILDAIKVQQQHESFKTNVMFKNYLKTTWRSLTANKLSSVINIGGLAVGMAASFLLMLYVYNEFSYDKFHKHSDRLFLVFKNLPNNGEVKTNPVTPGPLAAVLENNFPEIENVARVSYPEKNLLCYGDKKIKLSIVSADQVLLKMFSFNFVKGNAATALADQSGIVLTQSTANAIFGNTDPVGKTVKYKNQYPLIVKAVISDNPVNSGFSFQAITTWDFYMSQELWRKDAGWSMFDYSTYVLLKKDAQVSGINAKIKNLIAKYNPDDSKIELFLYPLTKLHLYNEFKNGVNTGGRIEYVRLFLILAVLILIIACVNFMNLSTALSEKRIKEVGVRKTIGATRITIIKSFLGTAVLTSFIALIIALTLIYILLPLFNSMLGIQLILPYKSFPVWLSISGIAFITALVAGSYPAVFFSSFNPVRALKGLTSSAGSMVKTRQALVVLQFVFAICLIISSIVIYKQISYIKNRPVGYNINSLIEIPTNEKLSSSFELFRQEAIKAGAISNAAISSISITGYGPSSWGVIWPDQLPGEDKIAIDCIGTTYHFIDTYGLTIAEGRDFEAGRAADSSAVILNEAAVKLMRLQEPVGTEITWQGEKRKIVGVVKNFVWGSPYESSKPLIIGFVKDWTGNAGIRLNPGMPAAESLGLLQSIYAKYSPDYPFEYTFTDESFRKKLVDEKVLGIISASFTMLTIFISCLGLFGLAAFSAVQRTKEIGIRKILGASVSRIIYILSIDFLKLVIIAFLVAFPVSWWLMNGWLEHFFYKISIDWWIFLLAGIGSILIALITISAQAIKAAVANPVRSLRTE